MHAFAKIIAIVCYGAMLVLTLIAIVLGVTTATGLTSLSWHYTLIAAFGAGISHVIWRELVWEKPFFGWWRR